MLATAAGLRSVRADDDVLLRRIFVDGRGSEFAALPISGAALDALLAMQERAQQAQFDQTYPDAQCFVITHDGADVGRLVIDEVGPRIRIVDLVVLTAYRRRGVGRAVLSDLQARASSLRLSVWATNQAARRLYDQLGLVAIAETGGYVEMQWDRADGVS
jgi:ribosomal protein S18 acetylase RimI-like enzyme